MVEVVVVGAVGFFGIGIYYFIIVVIIFYCNVYIILLCWKLKYSICIGKIDKITFIDVK